MSFNILINWNSCSFEQQCVLLMCLVIFVFDSIIWMVSDILDNVKMCGDDVLCEYSVKFDKIEVIVLCVIFEEIVVVGVCLSDELKQVMVVVVKNIEMFYFVQMLLFVDVEIQSGVCCQQVMCFVVFVGFYIFGGLVLFFLMVLMLVMLVCIVGCQNVVLCLLLFIVDEIFYVV